MSCIHGMSHPDLCGACQLSKPNPAKCPAWITQKRRCVLSDGHKEDHRFDEVQDDAVPLEALPRHPTRQQKHTTDEPRTSEALVDSEDCAFCGEPCDTLAANPGLWPVRLCHPDGTGIAKNHHHQCVIDRLFPRTNDALTDEDRLRVWLNNSGLIRISEEAWQGLLEILRVVREDEPTEGSRLWRCEKELRKARSKLAALANESPDEDAHITVSVRTLRNTRVRRAKKRERKPVR